MLFFSLKKIAIYIFTYFSSKFNCIGNNLHGVFIDILALNLFRKDFGQFDQFSQVFSVITNLLAIPSKNGGKIPSRWHDNTCQKWWMKNRTKEHQWNSLLIRILRYLQFRRETITNWIYHPSMSISDQYKSGPWAGIVLSPRGVDFQRETLRHESQYNVEIEKPATFATNQTTLN